MMLEDALAGRSSRVREDPARTRQFIHVDDVVDAVIATLDSGSLPRRSYNIGPGRLHRLDDVLAAVRQSLPNAHAVADPDGMAWNSFGTGLLRIDAARNDLGFEPTIGLADGVRDTLAWVRQRQSGHAA
jgi:UDP-glucuronate 4-epimerase